MEKVREIEQVLKPLLERNKFELIETHYRREAGKWVLRLFIDKFLEGEARASVTLDDCAKVSDLVGTELDSSQVLGDSYVLEVSSPGINRPLKTPAHFRGAIGKNVKVSLYEPLKPESLQRNFSGILVGFQDEVLEVQDATSGKVEIPLTAIAKAHLDLI